VSRVQSSKLGRDGAVRRIVFGLLLPADEVQSLHEYGLIKQSFPGLSILQNTLNDAVANLSPQLLALVLAGLGKHLHLLLGHKLLQRYHLPPARPRTHLCYCLPAEIFSVALLLGVLE
jgi:hypothetical protein